MTFNELGLNDQLLEALDYMGFTEATPIQEQAIPAVINGNDVLACAQTGTGKTGAFVMPILHKLTGKEDTSINTLIIVPTRELAIQIEQQIQGLSYFVSVGSHAIYGGGDGKDWSIQKEILTKGTDIVVATPGKLISHLKLGYVKFDKVETLILDEADRMLDMGFIDDLKKIISYLPKKHQTLMFSATMPQSIRELAKRVMTDPTEITLSVSKPAEGVKQTIYMAHDNQKIPTLLHILEDRKDYDAIIVFTSTKSKVSEIVRSLRKHKLNARGISSSLAQDEREEVLRKFRSKRVRILVATDVMSRGIDIKEINMVVNFDAPSDPEDYVHRVGRTARANTKGEAFTLVNDKDIPKIHRVEKLIEADLEKLNPPEELGEAPAWRKYVPKNKKRRNYRHKNKNRNSNNKNRSNNNRPNRPKQGN